MEQAGAKMTELSGMMADGYLLVRSFLSAFRRVSPRFERVSWSKQLNYEQHAASIPTDMDQAIEMANRLTLATAPF
jgi:hypothetical protein